ncbi:hypothetical protein IE53DRAFT_381668 [Violaceomyces palustris]|uniref:Uncharacterized protein n=1 Tax=Violaceomyces palustris TaxID=1673888 RepID=A0ACD0NQH7_9BASI|nr:hypothetical protein IE53DRAFT_381668 [Violaceomyces palustris]
MSEEKDPRRESTNELEVPDIPESQLTRMDPDSILADEADPDGLLGNESESEYGGANDNDSKRASSAISIFSSKGINHSKESEASSHPLTPEVSGKERDAATFEAGNATPRQPEFAIEAPEAKIARLEAQVSDLTNQVTGLNGKLVRSFERISDLEDDLSDAHARIMSYTTKIAELEKEREEHLAALNTGLLVERAHVSSEMQRMMDRVIEETAQRGKAQSDKERIEAELDELSASLFNEANKMVAVERLSRARAEEKSKQMEERLKDTEGIMLEQQKVLGDLQRQVEKQALARQIEGGEEDSSSFADSESGEVALKTSALVRSLSQRTTKKITIGDRKVSSVPSPGVETLLMIDIVPFQEFRGFVSHLRKLRQQLAPFYTYPLPGVAGSDPANGNLVSPGQIVRAPSPSPGQSVGIAGTLYTASTAYSQGYSGPTTLSPFAAAGISRHRDYPSLPSNVEQMVHLPSQLSLPFIKRSQEEDVEPCLRLDFAPGLNWLSRRQANTSILEGNLVIEPIFPGGKPADEDAVRAEHAHLPPAACSMCGIPVVNVPLPGGGSADSTAQEHEKKSSLVPSGLGTATANWASSAAHSLREVTGAGSSGRTSAASGGTLTPKSSRPSLFSSFRLGTGSTSSKLSSPTTANTLSHSRTDSDVVPTPDGAGQDGGDASGLQPPIEPAATMLPVPTHIFRLSEGASSRYLLCPHHCLNRLRAVCAFWGYLRTLERSLVLEGKFPVEELAPTLAAPPATSETEGSSKASREVDASDDADGVGAEVEPKIVLEDPEKKKSLVQGLEEEVERSEEKSKADQDQEEDAQPEGEKGIAGQEEAGKGKDGIVGDGKGETCAKEEDATVAVSGEDVKETVASDDEDGFSDANSSPPIGNAALGDDPSQDVDVKDDASGTSGTDAGVEAEKKWEESGTPSNRSSHEDKVEEQDGDSTPLASSLSQLGEKRDEEGISQHPQQQRDDDDDDDDDGSVTKGEEEPNVSKPSLGVAPPPLPRRSAARSSPKSPSTPVSGLPPVLPPRRSELEKKATPPKAPATTAQPKSSSQSHPSPATVRTRLALGGDMSELGWEEKLWTEITKLKEEMWRARIGLMEG